MAAEHSFDSFYGSTRRAVLRQTFALTGDLPATRAALRDSYARAWQHWGRVSRLEDPLAWVRARAWRLAEDRRGAPHEHGHPVLAALATLSPVQRRMLVLVGVSGLDAASAAR
jgi:DNA-directed RNA polymerase specialized sigma24 family protein